MTTVMHKVRSAGVLVIRQGQAGLECLVLRHKHRYDLPKGHLEPGETLRQAAIRELREETGLTSEAVVLDETFEFVSTYFPRYSRFGGERVEKTVTIFLGRLRRAVPIVLGEHPGFCWMGVNERVGNSTIDGALDHLNACLPSICDPVQMESI